METEAKKNNSEQLFVTVMNRIVKEELKEKFISYFFRANPPPVIRKKEVILKLEGYFRMPTQSVVPLFEDDWYPRVPMLAIWAKEGRERFLTKLAMLEIFIVNNKQQELHCSEHNLQCIYDKSPLYWKISIHAHRLLRTNVKDNDQSMDFCFSLRQRPQYVSIK